MSLRTRGGAGRVAIEFGFTVVIVAALGLYAGAALVIPRPRSR
jgi:hypothetical protein